MVQTRRNTALLIALLAGVCASAQAGISTQAVAAAQLPGLDVSFKTVDGWTIKGRWQPAKRGRMTLVLIHGTGRSKEIWDLFAKRLNASGYGTMAMDLRGHGESDIGPDGLEKTWRQMSAGRSNNDFIDMAHDIEAAIAYLKAAGTDEKEIGLIGEGLGASLALRYAAVNPQAPLVVLIAPGLDYQNVPVIAALRAYSSRPILIVYSTQDRASANAAPLLLAIAKISAGKDNASLIASPRPDDFLWSRAMAGRIIMWLKSPVKPDLKVSASTTTAASASRSPPALQQTPNPQALPSANTDQL
ncbi:MAG: alpha/beta hydrolase [Elusimicrobiota bacterium]